MSGAKWLKCVLIALQGICPLALTQWLTEQHNELVQVVSASIPKPRSGQFDAGTNPTEREVWERAYSQEPANPHEFYREWLCRMEIRVRHHLAWFVVREIHPEEGIAKGG